MTERQLKKLSRTELLEILLTQSREMDELKKRMAEAEEKLKARETVMAEAESLAAATAELKQLIATAQEMVDQLDRSRPEKEGASGQLPEKLSSDQEEHPVQDSGGSALDAEEYPGRQSEKIDSDQKNHPVQDSGESAPDAEEYPGRQSGKSDPDTEAFQISQEMKNCARKRKRALKKCRKNQSQNRKSP